MVNKDFLPNYLNGIRKRFPEFSKKTNTDLIELLQGNNNRTSGVYEKSFLENNPLLTLQEKQDYFHDFDDVPGTSTRAEELAQELSELHRKQVPIEILGNNYVVGVPGKNDKERKEYVRKLAETFGHAEFMKEIDKLSHFKNVFIFTLPRNGGTIPEHHHEQEARLFILDGSASDIEGKKVNAWGIVINHPLERHAYTTWPNEKLLAISRGADDGILTFDKKTGEFTGIKDFVL